jgi:hypothetical protein
MIMDIEFRTESADNLRSCADDFIGSLRLGRGMDEDAFTALRNAVINLGTAWEEADSLPKGIVNDLVGLYSWIESASHLYEGAEALRIRQAAMDVETLVFRHVVPASAES